MRDQGEGRLLLEPGDVLLRPGREVVHPDDFVALAQEAPREMGAEEAGRAREQDPPLHNLSTPSSRCDLDPVPTQAKHSIPARMGVEGS